jgi:hypothetical protein
MILSRFEKKLKSNLADWDKRTCPFCKRSENHFSYSGALCDKCVDALNRVPIAEWKSLKNKHYSKGNRKKGRIYGMIFKHRRSGKLLGIDPLHEKGVQEDTTNKLNTIIKKEEE